MAAHEAVCPACGSSLTVVVAATVGGSVQENVAVYLALSEEEQLAERLLAAKAESDLRAARAAAEATDAAKAVLAAAQKRQASTEAAAKVNAQKVATAKAALKGGADA